MSQKIIFEELEEVFGHFPKYHTKMLLGDFNVEVGREYFQANNWTGVSIRIVLMGLQ
jgi:hypothetical protein